MNFNFGHWLKTNRTQNGWSIKQLANSSGLGTGTISRIENDASSPNLVTAIRLLRGLGLSFPDLVNAFPELHVPSLVMPSTKPPYSGWITIHDVEAFINTCYQDPQVGTEIFISLLNEIYFASQTSHRGGDGSSGPFSTSDLEKIGPPFVTQDLYKLLSAHPLYQYEINYPVGLTSKKIKDIFLNGGALSFEAIGAYIRRLREEKNVTFRELDLPSKISASDMSRFESGAISKIKLEDVISLDRALGEDGVIFAMYWQSDQLYSLQFRRGRSGMGNVKSQGWTKQEALLVSGFIKLTRWFAYLDTLTDWLVSARRKFLKSGNS